MEKDPLTPGKWVRSGWRYFFSLFFVFFILLAGVDSARALYPVFDTSNHSTGQGITLKPDPRIVPRSMQVTPDELTVGDKVEVKVQIQNPDASALKRVRVRFTCGTQHRDLFVDLRAKEKKWVRVRFTTKAPVGIQAVKVEVNPIHRELDERDYRNNTSTARIVVNDRLARGLKLTPSRHSYQIARDFPNLTDVAPQTLSPGQEYTLKIQGSHLARDMKLDFGEGIRVTRTPLFYDTFLMVPVAVDAHATPGRRLVAVIFQGQRKVQDLLIVVEPAREGEGLKITPSLLEPGRRYTLDIKGPGLSPEMTVVLDGDMRALGGLEVSGEGEARLEVLVDGKARPGRHLVLLKGQAPGNEAPTGALLVVPSRELRGYVEVRTRQVPLPSRVSGITGIKGVAPVSAFYLM